jgi:hypothetical protein
MNRTEKVPVILQLIAKHEKAPQQAIMNSAAQGHNPTSDYEFSSAGSQPYKRL